MKFFPRIASILLALILLTLPLSAAKSNSVLDYLADSTPALRPAGIGGDWTVIALARGGELDGADDYYAAVIETVKSCEGVLHASRMTEFSRTVLALTAIGRNPSDVGGYNLLTPLHDFDAVTKQGVNGAAWALIALDSGDYEAPDGLRDDFVDYILSCQSADGSFTADADSDTPSLYRADYTAMSLLGLANYTNREDVCAAIDAGLAWLDTASLTTCEEAAQAIILYCTLGEEVDKSLLDALDAFRLSDGNYAHISGGKSNRIATEQAALALVAFDRAADELSPLYDCSDVVPDTSAVQTTSRLPGCSPDVIVPPIANPGVTFADISGENIHECQTAVEALASRGIVNGYGDDSYRPENSLTRAEFCALIVRALGLQSSGGSGFTDVPAGEWYAPYVNAAAEYSIVNGVGGGRFDPDGTITRQEAAVMCARAAKLCGMDTARDKASIRNSLSPFADYTKSADWAREALAFCCDAAILDPDALNLRPLDAVTRSEMAMMLYTLLTAAKLI
ncbi:MAG: S-layer homology domain-containing protein [Clostridia bacterium]|nr:S-layer homology domain-containing protein [Clostridia bacterium]